MALESGSDVRFFDSATAGIAALIGILQARKARGGFRSKSAATYTRCAILLVIAIGAGLMLARKLRDKPPLLDDTLAELAKDRDNLKARM